MDSWEEGHDAGEPKPQGQAAPRELIAEWRKFRTACEKRQRLGEADDELRAQATTYTRCADQLEATLNAAREPHAGERAAQIAAHRACCGTEHDPANGKLHGYCVVCGVLWPCEYAGKPPTPPASARAERDARLDEAKWWADHDIEDYDVRDQWDGIVKRRIAALESAARTPEPAPATPEPQEHGWYALHGGIDGMLGHFLCECGFDLGDCPVDEVDEAFAKHKATIAAAPPATPGERCLHMRLNEEGICRACGEDCRGINSPGIPGSAR